MKRLIGILGLVLTLLTARYSHSATWTLGQSGTEDFETLAGACASAGPGDTILVSPGYYDESEGFNWITVQSKPLSIIGLGANPDDTAFKLLLWLRDCDGTLLENLSVRDSGNWHPIAIDGGRIEIRNCTFRKNAGGAAVYSPAITSHILIEDCIFSNNRSLDPYLQGGAVIGAPLTVRRSLFIDNEIGRSGGAIFTGGGGLIEDCVFFRNKAPQGAALTTWYDTVVRNCTFLSNVVNSAFGGAICILSDHYVPIWNCIIAGTVNGYGVECPGNGTLVCCDFWDNDLGAHWNWWCDALEGNGNIHEDPLFCDPETGDVGLLEGSPCLPGNHGGMDCGLIGARGAQCGDVPVRETSWGRVKALYR